MKLTLLTLVLGYVVLFYQDSLPPWGVYVILFGAIFLSIFLAFIPKLKAEKSSLTRTNLLINIILVSGIIDVLLLFLFYYYNLPSYFWPVAVALVIFLRHPFQFLVKTSIKEPKGYGIRSETARGETVASKAEKKVADWFYHKKIPYIYEEQIEFPGGEKIKYDFYLPDEDIYVEYWGLGEAPGEVGERYRMRKKEKMEVYKKYGLRLLSITPGDLDDLDAVLPSRIRKLTGKGIFGKLIAMLFGKKYVHSSKIVKRVNKKSSTESEEGEAILPEKVFCPHCGHQMEGEEVIFCDNCGKSVEEK